VPAVPVSSAGDALVKLKGQTAYYVAAGEAAAIAAARAAEDGVSNPLYGSDFTECSEV
jgi:hypothetical protein